MWGVIPNISLNSGSWLNNINLCKIIVDISLIFTVVIEITLFIGVLTNFNFIFIVVTINHITLCDNLTKFKSIIIFVISVHIIQCYNLSGFDFILILCIFTILL